MTIVSSGSRAIAGISVVYAVFHLSGFLVRPILADAIAGNESIIPDTFYEVFAFIVRMWSGLLIALTVSNSLDDGFDEDRVRACLHACEGHDTERVRAALLACQGIPTAQLRMHSGRVFVEDEAWKWFAPEPAPPASPLTTPDTPARATVHQSFDSFTAASPQKDSP